MILPASFPASGPFSSANLPFPSQTNTVATTKVTSLLDLRSQSAARSSLNSFYGTTSGCSVNACSAQYSTSIGKELNFSLTYQLPGFNLRSLADILDATGVGILAAIGSLDLGTTLASIISGAARVLTTIGRGVYQIVTNFLAGGIGCTLLNVALGLANLGSAVMNMVGSLVKGAFAGQVGLGIMGIGSSISGAFSSLARNGADNLNFLLELGGSNTRVMEDLSALDIEIELPPSDLEARSIAELQEGTGYAFMDGEGTIAESIESLDDGVTSDILAEVEALNSSGLVMPSISQLNGSVFTSSRQATLNELDGDGAFDYNVERSTISAQASATVERVISANSKAAADENAARREASLDIAGMLAGANNSFNSLMDFRKKFDPLNGGAVVDLSASLNQIVSATRSFLSVGCAFNSAISSALNCITNGACNRLDADTIKALTSLLDILDCRNANLNTFALNASRNMYASNLKSIGFKDLLAYIATAASCKNGSKLGGC